MSLSNFITKFRDGLEVLRHKSVSYTQKDETETYQIVRAVASVLSGSTAAVDERSV